MKNKQVNPLNISKPTLILDKQKAIKNIQTMASKTKESGVRFRPHFKIHQSAEIGNWFKDFGVNSIAVSSVDMAQYFAQHGWQESQDGSVRQGRSPRLEKQIRPPAQQD